MLILTLIGFHSKLTFVVRNIIFDFGNVLGTCNKHTSCESLAKYSRTKTGAEIYAMLVESDLERYLESGAINGQIFAKKVISIIQAEGLSIKKCLEIWGNVFKQNSKIVPLLIDLRRRNIGMAVLSNTNEVHRPYILALGSMKLLESWNVPFILSYKENSLKPETKMYVSVLSALKCAADNAVFIDDVWGNVEAAKRLGMSGIIYNCEKDSVEYLKNSLSQLLGL